MKLSKDFKAITETNTKEEFNNKFELRTYTDYGTTDVSLFENSNLATDVKCVAVCPYDKKCDLNSECAKCWTKAIEKAYKQTV
jgi:hypothetical protein